MRILLYGLNFPPEVTGVGRYTGEMVEWLDERQHEVRVVTSYPYYPEWRVADGYDARTYRRTRWGGAGVVRCPLWVPDTPTGSRRLIHLTSYAVSSAPALMYEALRFRPSLVVTVVPTLFTAPVGHLVSRMVGAASWLHVQDLELDAAFELDVLSGRTARTAARAAERTVLNRFDAVSTISRAMADRIDQKLDGADRSCILLPNWVDTEEIYPTEGISSYRSEVGFGEDDLVVLYSGNLGRKQGLDHVVEAAERLRADDDVQFVICGEGSEKSRLLAATRDLPHVRVLSLQPSARFNELLNLGDVHLVPQCRGASDLVMPSKLAGILACGGRVVATADEESDLARVVRSGGGRACAPEDVDALVRSIRAAADEVRRERARGAGHSYCRRAREYAERYLDRDTVLGRLEERLRATVEARRNGSTA